MIRTFLSDRPAVLREAAKAKRKPVWLLFLFPVILFTAYMAGEIPYELLPESFDKAMGAGLMAIRNYFLLVPIALFILFVTKAERRSVRSMGFVREKAFCGYATGMGVGIGSRP